MIWLQSPEAPNALQHSESGVASTLGKKLKKQFHQTLFSDQRQDVRGAGVATGILLDLFVSSHPGEAWTVNVPVSHLQQAKAWAQDYSSLKNADVAGSALPRVPDDHASFETPRIWCDLSAVTLARSIAARGSFFKVPYPILSINHTISMPNLLQDAFVPLLIRKSYLYDRQVCSTKTSAVSLQALIEYQSEKLKLLGLSEASYRGRIEVIPIPTDTDRFVPGDRKSARKKLGLAQDAFVLLYFGFIGISKADLGAYLVTLRRLVEQNKDRKIIWCIAGTAEVPYLNFLKQFVRRLGLGRNVYIETDVSAADKLLFYQAADIFVSPSDTVQESFGMTVVEAMACGLPQVVSDWDGYRELVVHGETGFKVATAWADCTDEFKMPFELEVWGRDHVGLGQSVSVDLEEWYKSIQTLLSNEDLRRRMGEASRRRAVALYSNQVVAAMHKELWREAEAQCARSTETLTYQPELSAPDYFRCFGHYASEIVGEATLLRRTGASDDTVRRELETYRTLPAMNSLLDVDLIFMLLAAMGQRTVSLGEVCGNVCEAAALHASAVRRHMMWLVKHGAVRIVRGTVA